MRAVEHLSQGDAEDRRPDWTSFLEPDAQTLIAEL